MSGYMGQTTANDWLKLALNSVALSVAYGTTLYVTLHSADPTATGNQSTNELAYAGMGGRVGVTRNGAGGWDVVNNGASNHAAVTFGACTSGTATAAYASIGLASSGAGQILYAGPLNSSLAISTGIQPYFPAAALAITQN